MDSLTQSLLGAAIAEAGFRKKLGWKAVLFGGLCGMLPDLDIFSAAAGPWASLKYHRGETHSFIIMPLLIFGAAWLGYIFARKKGGYFRWLHLAAWVLFTHILLDWGTSYGTQLFAPFSRRRFAFDAIAIIDFFYSAPLLIAVIAACIVKIPQRVRRGIAIGALALSTAYFILGYAQNRKALGIAAKELNDGKVAVQELRATPCLLTVFCWRIIARDSDGNFHIGVLSTWNPAPIKFHRTEKSDNPLVRKTLEHEHAKLFKWFAQDLIHAEAREDEHGTTVILQDMRYGLVSTPLSPVFAVKARYNRKGELLFLWRDHGKFDRPLSEEWDALWSTTAGKPK